VIHFFPTFGREAAASPFGEALRQSGVPHRIFAGEVRFNYRSRLELLLVCIPRLAWFAARSVVASLLLSRPPPDVVVVGSDVEVLAFALGRALLRRRVRIVLGSFIFTGRSTSWENTVRRAYFRFVLGRTDLAIVHSRLEVERYRAIFTAPRTRFVFIPWGTTIALRKTVMGDARIAPGEAGVVTAGKSGRDYRTLFAAMAEVPAELRVICDYAGALAGAVPGARTTVLADCHGLDYFTELARAAVVAIPLAVEDISAGQMVLVQSMGMGKAIVISSTPTICDYVTHGHDALLVPCGDAAALHGAILLLLGDRELRVRLGGNARTTFDADLSTEGHLRRLLAAIAELG